MNVPKLSMSVCERLTRKAQKQSGTLDAQERFGTVKNVQERSRTLDGLKRLKNHVHVHASKNNCKYVQECRLNYCNQQMCKYGYCVGTITKYRQCVCMSCQKKKDKMK